MKVGVVAPGVPMEIALNKESKRKTPAVIAFRDGDRIFGEDAQTIGLRFPDKSFSYVIDLLGKTIDNPLVDLYRKRFPYYNIEGDSARKTIVFKTGDESYTVEELVAQFIQKARDFAEESTGQHLTECVLIVPGFFGQAERRALLTAADLAGVKVLQIINDYTAVAMNYGIFRRNEINETAQYFVFYDMGAYKTSAAVVSFQLVKDKATRETNPVIQVLGVGYDRTLGGLEMQLRLRDFLAKEFNAMKKTKTDVFTSPRALAKLFKEAGRVKNVLSANANHFAQIEGLLDDHDFKLQVTREQFEELSSDLFARVADPLNQALKNAGIGLEVVNQVILFGGGTRVPKVQEVLKAAINQELGKNINMDEAAAMGAVYRAADLATGFKVKKVITKDATLFPIQVTFEREGESGNMRLIKRNLFSVMNPFPQKKMITFNKHTQDFDFNVNYADLDHLSAAEVSYLGSVNLNKIKLTKVAKLLADNVVDENVESKGIKAHFSIDDSGIFELSGIELVLEKTLVEPTKEQSLFNSISSMFSSDKETDSADTKTDEEPAATPQPEGGETESANNTEQVPNGNATDSENVAATNKTEPPKPKVVTVKEPIPNSVELLFALPLEGSGLDATRKKINELNAFEQKKIRRENALNALESHVIDTNQKMDETEYASCATEETLEAVRKACAEVSDWLYEDGEDADAETYEKRLVDLKKLTSEIYGRHWEHSERAEAVRTLRALLKSARDFHTNGKNYTKEVNEDRDVFTPVELETLLKTITETDDWLVEELDAQEKLARHEPVRLTVKSLAEKMALVDREVKYLMNKLKIWRPKVPPKAQKNDTKKGTTTNGTEDSDEEKPIFEDSEDEHAGDENSEEPVVDESENLGEPEIEIDPSETSKSSDNPIHSEL